MIRLPPHRTKGGVVLGATGPGRVGPFGRWDDDSDPEEETLPAAGGGHGALEPAAQGG